jgi:hypothetical protein
MATRTVIDAPGRLIFGLMVFTMAFSLVGGEIQGGSGGTQSVKPVTIIIGGTVATSLLTLISHAGEVGEHFATGLATIAFTTSALVYGKPVWDKLNQEFGSKPTGSTPLTESSTQTAATMATAQAVPLVAQTALTAGA